MSFRNPLSILLAAVPAAWLVGVTTGCAPKPRAEAAAPRPADSATASGDTQSTAAAPMPADTAAGARSTSTAAPAPVGADSSGAAPAAPPPPRAPPAAAPATAAADSQWVKWDPSSKTATFRLVSGPFVFDGYGSGGATLTVPPGSKNVWNFEQADGTPHSAEVDAGTGPIPNSGGNAAIPRAYTNKVVEGLPQGAKDVITFTAPDTGTFRIICGVPGHALSGMWIWFKVDPAAKAATFGPTPGK
jgi:plastocyanin